MARNYPTVFVHGFLGWGEEEGINKMADYWGVTPDKSVVKHMRSLGYEVYAPSVGPFNSVWDRSCILYAYLFGGQVDFGAAHAKKYGHARYGRTFPGVLKDWGQPGAHAKINLIGHSFGGPTIIEFSKLLTKGDEEERLATPEDELSPLFKGGRGNLIHTVTTLSGVNNGTTMSTDMIQKGTARIMSYSLLHAICLYGNLKPVVNFWDFNMDQWGLMKDPEDLKVSFPGNPLNHLKTMRTFCNNELDNVSKEMGIEGAYKLLEDYYVNPGTWYFARRAQRSQLVFLDNSLPTSDALPFCRLYGYYTGTRWSRKMARLTEDQKREWTPNDGFVNVKGQSAPHNKPSVEADFNGPFTTPGLWYNLPVERKDHISWNGAQEEKHTYFKYYEDMFRLFASLPDGEAFGR